MLDFFSFWSTVTARVKKFISRNALVHQLSRKPSFELLHSNAETGNEPLSEAFIAPIVLYVFLKAHLCRKKKGKNDAMKQGRIHGYLNRVRVGRGG